MKRRTIAVLSLCLLSVSTLMAQTTQHRLLAYYPSWARYQTPAYNAQTIPYHKLTHIAHAFLLLNAAGDGTFNLAQSDLDSAQLVPRAHAAGVPVVISVGGADPVQAAAFESIANHEAYRTAFAANLAQFVSSRGYNGVDIDWEVPQGQIDFVTCKLMMQAVRKALPRPFYLISMAVPSDPRQWGDGFDIPGLTPTVDFFNVMTYDFHGPWTNHAGHNSPLVLSPYDPGQEGSLRTSMDLYEGQYGVPHEKLNIGTALYGYEFDSASGLWKSCGSGCGSMTNSWNYGTYIKQRVNANGWKRYFDPIAEEPYLLRWTNEPVFDVVAWQSLLSSSLSPHMGFITYDDPASSARKTKYVVGDRGFGGVFMWDLSGDYDGRSQDLLDAMYTMLKSLE